MLHLIERAVQCSRLAGRPVEIENEIANGDTLIGRSPGMLEIYKEIGRIAAQPVTVLIRGETGTGKELVACALRRFSDRLQKPFVTVNCAAIPETLLESELFGHEKGAFTGADARRIGRFEQADGGTLFLDEIGGAFDQHAGKAAARAAGEDDLTRRRPGEYRGSTCG